MKIVFMGTPRSAVPSLEKILADGHQVTAVYTQPDRPSGRGRQLSQPPVKEFALSKGLPVLQPEKIKTPDALAEFRSHDADAAVVVAYGRILPDTFLRSFTHGAINLHFSLLPKYRGAAPVNWAIVHREKTTGVTTMQMDSGLDTGPVLMQRETAIDATENASDLLERLSVIGADLLSETLSRITSLTPQPQDGPSATVAPILKKEDGLISWMLSAEDIAARVRGFQPFPTAFTYHSGKRLTIWSARRVESPHKLLRPGQIVDASGDKLTVFCGGDSLLCLEELQLEGKRRMSARDFINGTRPEPGVILGT